MQKNLIKISIIILVVIMILVSVIGTILYLTTDALKSKDVLFQKYILQNVEAVVDMVDFSNEEKYIKALEQSDYLATTTGKLKYLETQNDEEETYEIKTASISKKAENKLYRKVMATYDNEELLSAEILRDNDTIGLRLTNLVNQFVSAQNKTLPYFVSNLGYNGEYVSETLKKVDLTDVFKFSDSELQVLKNTYMNAIFTEIDQKAYTSKDAIITLKNGQSPAATSYTLTLTQNDLDKVYKRVLNQAITDQIILQKIEQIDQKLAESGINLPEGEKIKARYINYLTQLANSVEYNGEDDRKTTFTVYQVKGQTVRTRIKNYAMEILIDIDKTKGNSITVEIIRATDTGTDSQTYTLSKQVSENEIQRIASFNNSTKNLELGIKLEQQNNSIETNMIIDYSSNQISEMNFEVNSKADIASEQAIKVVFNDDNNIILNDYEGEQITSIFNNLENRITDSLRESQSKLNIKLLQKIVDYLDKREEKAKEAVRAKADEKTQEFNNQFELYAGTNLDYDHMQRLLNAVSKNMSGYKIVDGNKIEIIIEEGKENKDKLNEIQTAVTNKYTYNVDFNYNENGRITSIDIYRYIENS